jgi:uncharacterized membrane protein YgaE (UPF0421/DUF939 family)
VGQSVEELIKSARKQIISIVVGGIISAFTINLIFIFSINATIEELREYKNLQKQEIKEMRGEILYLLKNKKDE